MTLKLRCYVEHAWCVSGVSELCVSSVSPKVCAGLDADVAKACVPLTNRTLATPALCPGYRESVPLHLVASVLGAGDTSSCLGMWRRWISGR